MLSGIHNRFLIVGSLAMGIWSCGSKKDPDKTAADSAAVTDSTIDIPDLVSKLTWKAIVNNNSTGKIFSGFDGSNVFKVLLGADVYGELPELVKLNDDQYETFYKSPEFAAKYKTEIANMSLEVDSTLVSSKANDIDGYRIYELRTLKAGTGTIKVKYGTTEIPLTITIAAYTPAQVALGKTRYNTAVAGATPSPSCASCHRSDTGVDHSPFFLAQFTDAALLSTIKTGTNSDDQYKTEKPHNQTFANAADEAAIIPYLRSLDPNLLPKDQSQ